MSESPRKKRIWPWVVAVGLVVGVLYLFALVAYLLFARSMSPAAAPITRGTVLELDLSGPLTEGPPVVDFGLFSTAAGRSMWELRRALRAAADDADIAAILLEIHNSTVGWANAEELLGYLDAFRESGKPIYALLPTDLVSDLDYFLATGANRIWVTPEAGVVVNGLVAEAQFLRGSFEKLHIEPQVIMYKEYKSAGELFANYEMSPHMREALTAVLRTMDDRFTERVAQRRSLEPAEIESFVARGMATAHDLVELGLADEIGYIDQVEEAFTEVDGIDSFRSVSLSSYIKSLPSPPTGRRRIAVVFGEGPIVAQEVPAPFPFLSSAIFSGPAVARHIRRAALDSRVEAIVFRVSSPGGSPVGSDLVRREIENARAVGKPVVVSMSDVAGSGGYWVSMAADAIVAQPTTITGSIGVIFQKLNLDGFWEWMGAHVDRVTTAPRAEILGTGPWDEMDKKAIEIWMDQIYGSFTESVAKARDLELDQVLEIARGRIWSGRDALELQLVDRLGGFDDAVELAKELAGLDADRDYPLEVFPRPKSFFQRLMEDDWSATGRGLGAQLDPAALVRWAEEAARPRVLAEIPRIRIH